jgi:hypothetical protein
VAGGANVNGGKQTTQTKSRRRGTPPGGEKMTLPQLRQLLADAIRQGKKFTMTAPGGTGAYGLKYDPSYALTVNGHRVVLFDVWCGGNVEGYCYRRHLGVGDCEDNCWRVSHLDGVSRKLLERIPFASNQDIAKEFADVLGDAVVPPDA